jgi:adenylosuccinate synthase
MIPSGLGLVNQKCVNLIGSGTVVHIPAFFQELDALKAHGVIVEDRLFISDRAHVVLDLHQRVDGLEEKELSGEKIGTTGKGVLPHLLLIPNMITNTAQVLGQHTAQR